MTTSLLWRQYFRLIYCFQICSTHYTMKKTHPANRKKTKRIIRTSFCDTVVTILWEKNETKTSIKQPSKNFTWRPNFQTDAITKTLTYFITGTPRSVLMHPYNTVGTRRRKMNNKNAFLFFFFLSHKTKDSLQQSFLSWAKWEQDSNIQQIYQSWGIQRLIINC